MEISLGIITHKDAPYFEKLYESVLNQHLKDIVIREIIAVCVKEDVPYIRRIAKGARIFSEPVRNGKYSAVNIFLEKARSDVLVMSSGDIILDKGAIEKLCSPLKDKKIGIVASRPVPLDCSGHLGMAADVVWKLHHQTSLIEPKFGELIAFRKPGRVLSSTAVDEEAIASMLVSQGYEKAYAQDAVIYNRKPSSLKAYLDQRRRIYCGHLRLQKKSSYKVPTSDSIQLLKLVLGLRPGIHIVYAAALEFTARTFGTIDYLLGRDHTVWKLDRPESNSLSLIQGSEA